MKTLVPVASITGEAGHVVVDDGYPDQDPPRSDLPVLGGGAVASEFLIIQALHDALRETWWSYPSGKTMKVMDVRHNQIRLRSGDAGVFDEVIFETVRDLRAAMKPWAP